jgi:hypothetical protein
VRKCRTQDLFIRDASQIGSGLGKHALRIAVKDGTTISRMVKILAETLDPAPDCIYHHPTFSHQ